MAPTHRKGLLQIKAAIQSNDFSKVPATAFRAAGIAGVTTKNLPAVTGALKESTGLRSVLNAPALQAAVKKTTDAIVAITRPKANATAAQYAAIGASIGRAATDAENRALLNNIVGAQPSTSVDTVAEINDLARIANAIQEIAAGGSPASLTAADFVKIGVTGVTSGNLSAILDAIAAQADGGGATDSVKELQAIVTAYVALLNEANGATADSSSSDPGASQYAIIGASIGLAARDSENLALLNDIIGGRSAGDVDTVAEINELAAIANGVQEIAAGRLPTPALTAADFAKIGVTGVTSGNLSAILDAIKAQADGGGATDSLQELQAIVNAYVAVLDEANGATTDASPSDPSASQYAVVGASIGLAARDSENLALLNDIVGAQASTGVDAIVEINELARIANAIQEIAAGRSPTPALAAADFAKICVTAVTSGNLSAILDAIKAQADTGADTDSLTKLQAIVNAYVAVLDEANGATADASPTDLSASQYTTIGASIGRAATDAENLALLNDIVGAQASTGVDAIVEINELARIANAIQEIAAGRSPTPALAAADFAKIGVIAVTSGNLSAILDAIKAQADTGADTDSLTKLQAIVNAYVAVLDEANGAAADASSSDPSVDQYAVAGASIGLAVTDAENLALLNDIVGAQTSTGVDTVAEINELARIANVIQEIAAGGSPTPALTAADFAKIGVTGVTSGNLSAILDAIKAQADTGADTDSLTKLQAIVNAYNKILTPGSNPAAADYAAIGASIGLAATDSENRALLNDIVGGRSAGDVDMIAEINELAAIANALQDIAAGLTPSRTLSATDFAKIGVNGVTNPGNLSAILDAIKAQADGGADTDSLTKVQAIVDAYNKILTPGSNPAAADYADIGASIGLAATDSENLALLNDIIGAQAASGVVTIVEIDELARIANAIQQQAAGVTPSPALTVADFVKIGVTGVTTGNLPSVFAAISAAADDGTETGRLSDLQSVVAIVAPIVTTAPSGVGLTVTSDQAGTIKVGGIITSPVSAYTTTPVTLTEQSNSASGLVTVTNAAGSSGTDSNGYSVYLGTSAANSVAGFQYVWGFGGDDTITGSAGVDTLYAGDGNDALYADDLDFIDGGNDFDEVIFVSAVSASNLLDADLVNVESVHIAATTSASYDFSAQTEELNINDSVHADTIIGGSGDDTLGGFNGGNDTLTGGAGNDIFYVAYNAATVTITDFSKSGANGTDALNIYVGARAIVTGVLDYRGYDVSNLGTLDINGTSAADAIFGSGGNDSITGGAGDDAFNITGGSDTISDLGNGSDILVVSSGATANITATSSWTATAGSSNAGAAIITSNGYNIDLTRAGGASGWIITNTGASATLSGSDNSDTINAGANGDTVAGGVGGDKLYGGVGADTFLQLNGSSPTVASKNTTSISNGGDYWNWDSDVNFGDKSNNEYLSWTLGSEPDRIYNFDVAYDKIKLSAFATLSTQYLNVGAEWGDSWLQLSALTDGVTYAVRGYWVEATQAFIIRGGADADGTDILIFHYTGSASDADMFGNAAVVLVGVGSQYISFTDSNLLSATDVTRPLIPAYQVSSYNENRPAGTIIQSVSATDNIGVTGFRFTNSGGTPGEISSDGFLSIDALGNISLTAAGAASTLNDYEANTNHEHIYYIQARDLAGNWSTSTAVYLYDQDIDDTAPTMSSAVVATDGRSIVITYSEAVAGSLEASDWSFKVAGVSYAGTISSPVIGGADNNMVTLTLSSAIAQGAVTSDLTYTATSGTANSLTDRANPSNIAVTQTVMSITNNSTFDGTAPTINTSPSDSGLTVSSNEAGTIKVGGINATAPTSSYTNSPVTLTEQTAVLSGFVTVTDAVGNVGADTKSVYLGTPSSNTVTGTRYVWGWGGNDTITGTTNDDYLYGGDDNDVIAGLAGYDIIYGGAGDDKIIGGTGYDLLWGGAGSDVFVQLLGDSANWVTSTDTDNYLSDDEYVDWRTSGDWPDVINDFDDTEDKIQVNSTVTALKNYDLLDGGVWPVIRKDTLSANTVYVARGNWDNGRFTYKPLSGSDLLVFTSGADKVVLVGQGSNIDNITLANNFIASSDVTAPTVSTSLSVTGLTVTSNEAGTIKVGGTTTVPVSAYSSTPITLTEQTSAISGVVTVTDPARNVGTDTNGRSVYLGTSAANTVTGFQFVWGFGGDDTITGTSGNDTVYGGAGVDTFNITAGTDVIGDLGAGGTDVVIVSAGATLFSATATGAWTASATTSNSGTATIIANGYAISVASAIGTKGWTITNSGNATGVTLTGSAYADTISGGGGIDLLKSGLGADTLTGRNSGDEFFIALTNSLYTSGATSRTFDYITDFNHSQGDRINVDNDPITNIDFSFFTSANNSALSNNVTNAATYRDALSLLDQAADSGFSNGGANNVEAALISVTNTGSNGFDAGYYIVIDNNGDFSFDTGDTIALLGLNPIGLDRSSFV